MTTRIYAGDCRDVLRAMPDASVHCVVTSPPYYGLRDYGTAQWDGGDADCDHLRPFSHLSSTLGASTGGRSDETHMRSVAASTSPYRDICGKCGARRIDRQMGLEATPDAYLQAMVAVFREVRRVLRPDGTLWLNIGDSYNANQGNGWTPTRGHNGHASPKVSSGGLAPKQLMMMPARLALALQADGWWLRSDIIWAKPNPMPESVRDRPTSAHEHVFLLTKSARYYYDADAVREEAEYGRRDWSNGRRAWDALGVERSAATVGGADPSTGRNLRNVWTIATEAFPEAHFATFPTALAERCIKAGTKPGDTVLDPFAGAGTTLLVADRLQREAIGIDLNAAYTEMALARCKADAPLLTHIADAADDAYDQPMRDLFQEAAD